MNHTTLPHKPPAVLTTNDLSIAQLVGRVYESAPPAVQKRLLAQLIKPLGLLSLAAVANGIFANLRFRSTELDTQAGLEGVHSVQTHHVITLVNYVQQVSIQAVDGLADLLATSPMVASSTAAAVLVSVLMQRARKRKDEEKYHTDEQLA